MLQAPTGFNFEEVRTAVRLQAVAQGLLNVTALSRATNIRCLSQPIWCKSKETAGITSTS